MLICVEIFELHETELRRNRRLYQNIVHRQEKGLPI